ncbi:hypothetical protein ACFO4O_04345 [Glaciecola siphonariae]|uniref:Uncharacterized protein n=1 Tax=Glaciecola siphonariae TaxID=521012 RepID=A0ABV9LTV6_9ALTE
MHKVREILDEFETALKPLVFKGRSITVQRINPNTVDTFPTVRVGLGPDVSEGDSFDSDQQNLTVFTDIHFESSSLDIENDAIDAREQVENLINMDGRFAIADVLYVRFQEAETLDWNDQKADMYAVKQRLIWQVSYVKPPSY